MPKEKHELWGEAITDIGILILVFSPLEIGVQGEFVKWWGAILALALAIGGVYLIWKGIKLGSQA